MTFAETPRPSPRRNEAMQTLGLGANKTPTPAEIGSID